MLINQPQPFWERYLYLNITDYRSACSQVLTCDYTAWSYGGRIWSRRRPWTRAATPGWPSAGLWKTSAPQCTGTPSPSARTWASAFGSIKIEIAWIEMQQDFTKASWPDKRFDVRDIKYTINSQTYQICTKISYKYSKVDFGFKYLIASSSFLS